MRHAKRKYQMNRFTSWRKATLRSMARNLVIYESMRTSLQKAKALRPVAEKLISLAKQNDLAAKRRAFGILGDHALVARLFSQIGPRFANTAGGYTRIIQIGVRRGDDAPMAIFELVHVEKKKAAPRKKEKTQKTEAATEDKLPETAGPGPQEKKHDIDVAVKEKPPITKKPSKKFLGGIRSIFRKKSDSL